MSNYAETTMVAPSSRFKGNSRSSPNISRSPLILEFGQNVIRVGYSGEPNPKRIIPLYKLPDPLSDPPTWYRYLSALLQSVYDSLMQDPFERKVVVLSYLYPSKAWKEAILRWFWEVNTPAVSFRSSIECTPMMFPSVQDFLLVSISTNQANCMVHAKGQSLEYTYQSVPLVWNSSTFVLETLSDEMEDVLLSPSNPQSVVTAILKCVEACPLLLRKDVVGNILMSGELVAMKPNIPIQIVQKIQDLLEQTTDGSTSTKTLRGDINLSQVPVSTTHLQCLSNSLGLLKTSPYRADLLSWAGASIWASYWHLRDADSASFEWQIRPND